MYGIERSAKEFRAFLGSSYRKRKVRVVAAETVTLCDLNWSGGTRSHYQIFDIATAQPVSDTGKYAMCAPWANPAEGVTLPIPLGACVIRTGHFCGHESVATVYVNPADMPRVLPAN
jgi:hypothetical protein